MKTLIFGLIFSLTLFATDHDYKLDGKTYEGYYLKKSSSAPTVFLIHDWDGIGKVRTNKHPI